MTTSLIEGNIEEIINVSANIKQSKNGKWVHQRVNYTNGGITVNYTPVLFTSEPIVNVTLSLNNLTYSSDLILTSIVTSNTSSGVTIRVNKEIGGTVTEAATNDVFVNIFSIL